jgi:hypothetical protein
MDKKLKEKWVKALRSPKYKQARGVLADADGALCCIGVLRHIQGDTKKLLQDERTTALRPIHLGGLSEDERETLVRMNDGTAGHNRHTFSEIADYIEKNIQTD